MKLSEIQPNKTYYKSQTRMCGRMRTKNVTGIKVFVMQVDTAGNRVLASLNGQPAQWFNSYTFSKWKTQDPTSNGKY